MLYGWLRLCCWCLLLWCSDWLLDSVVFWFLMCWLGFICVWLVFVCCWLVVCFIWIVWIVVGIVYCWDLVLVLVWVRLWMLDCVLVVVCVWWGLVCVFCWILVVGWGSMVWCLCSVLGMVGRRRLLVGFWWYFMWRWYFSGDSVLFMWMCIVVVCWWGIVCWRLLIVGSGCDDGW